MTGIEAAVIVIATLLVPIAFAAGIILGAWLNFRASKQMNPVPHALQRAFVPQVQVHVQRELDEEQRDKVIRDRGEFRARV